MTAAWMLYVLLVGTLLAVGAFAIDTILRRTALPTRWVWMAALGGMVAFAVVAPRRDAAESALNFPVAVRMTSAATNTTESLSAMRLLVQRRDAIVAWGAHTISAATARVPESLLMPLILAWGLLSATLLALLVIVNRRVHRARHDWPMQVVHGIAVRVAPDLGPAVIGLSKPEIVVPRWLLERSAEEQRLVVVHEREHVTAHDQILPIGGWIIAALIPWHPAVWWALSRLRLAIELDCDARVLEHGVMPGSYGMLLIDIAGQCAGHRMGALALADRTSHLERRLLAMKPTRSRFPVARTAALASIAALSIVMACEARLPTAAEVDKMDVASAEKTAAHATLIDGKGSVTYKVNGVVVTAAEAHAIASARIASINVAKSAGEGPKSDGTVHTMVNISTADGGSKEYPLTVRYKEGTLLETKRGTMNAQGFSGLLFIDGVLAPEGSLAKLSRDDIASVEILKGEAAAKISSDPAAANGVIRVTTKH